VNFWDDIGGNYTDEEIAHIDNIDVGDMEDHKFALSEDERNTIYNSTPEERHKIVKNYEQNAHDTMQAVDEHVSIPIEGEPPRTMSGDFAAGLNPINLVVGYASQKSADALLNSVDAEMPIIPKTILSGGLGGAGGEAAIMALSGLGAGISATALAPAALVGSAASLTGLGTEALLDQTKLKDNQLAKTVIEGSTSGAVAGAGTLLASAGTGALLGAEAGIPLDAVTFGASSLVGAGLGSIIGLGSYGISKLF